MRKTLIVFGIITLLSHYLQAQIKPIIEIPFSPIFFLKNDTAYMCYVYHHNNAEIDSVIITDTIIRSEDKKYWINENDSVRYEYKFRKGRLSKYFSKNSPLFFYAESELRLKLRITHYKKDTSLKEYNRGCNTSKTRFFRLGPILWIRETRSNCGDSAKQNNANTEK